MEMGSNRRCRFPIAVSDYPCSGVDSHPCRKWGPRAIFPAGINQRFHHLCLAVVVVIDGSQLDWDPKKQAWYRCGIFRSAPHRLESELGQAAMQMSSNASVAQPAGGLESSPPEWPPAKTVAFHYQTTGRAPSKTHRCQLASGCLGALGAKRRHFSKMKCAAKRRVFF